MQTSYRSSDIQVPIPHSRMEWPSGTINQIKFLYWKLYTPFHPVVRDVSLALGIMHHTGRQPFLLGTLDPSCPVNEFVSHLVRQGYRNHFIAWEDDAEILSLRKTCGFSHQYHIRLFADGEVRAHYEYTPEAHPFLHMHEVGMESRKQEFQEVIDNRVRWA